MAIAARASWTENAPSKGWRLLHLRELWEYRELVYFLALRDIQAQYKQAAFGIAWAVVQPLAGVLLFTVVFAKLAHVSSEGIPYPVFALVGYLVWTYFSSTITTAATSIVTNAHLMTKIYFPRVAAPLSALLPGFISLAPGLVLLAVLMVIEGAGTTVALVALPLCLVWMVVVSLGFSLLFAAVNVKYRDVGTVISTLTQLWLFACPVAYPSSLVTGGWRWLYFANPVVGLIDSFRWCLVGTPFPGAEVAVSAATTLLVFGIGVAYFARTERQFADIV
ncbi:MAG TPA: ABC transporter permease [Solirubrobacteraceae bacterium]|nr:ABC transporter permease [Solirubrobacteraceae bacterium]